MRKAKHDHERREVAPMLGSYVRFRESVAADLFARLYLEWRIRNWERTVPERCAEAAEVYAAEAVASADALARELDRTDESRADHPARKKEE